MEEGAVSETSPKGSHAQSGSGASGTSGGGAYMSPLVTDLLIKLSLALTLIIIIPVAPFLSLLSLI